jgi:hypothetical protein
MAVVVNGFHSPDVQRQVYEELIQALNAKLESEGAGSDPRSSVKTSAANGKATADDGDIAHDLVEGASIHAVLPRV